MVDLRVKASVTPERASSDNKLLSARGLRGGELVVANWATALALEGRLFIMQYGNEDAPIDATTTIDDELCTAVVDAVAGTTVIPAYGQGVVATWSDSSALDYLIAIDTVKRYNTGGTSFTALSLRTDGAIASTSEAYVGADITLDGKTAEREVYRETIELNTGDATHYWPKMEYLPLKGACIPPILVGPASLVNYFGSTSGGTDITVYGNLQFFEIPSTMVTG